jgi:hypothetical protein
VILGIPMSVSLGYSSLHFFWYDYLDRALWQREMRSPPYISGKPPVRLIWNLWNMPSCADLPRLDSQSRQIIN